MNVTCREFADFMADYLSGELTPDLREPFDHHLSLCVNCQRYLSSYRETVALGKRAFDILRPTPMDHHYTRAGLEEDIAASSAQGSMNAGIETLHSRRTARAWHGCSAAGPPSLDGIHTASGDSGKLNAEAGMERHGRAVGPRVDPAWTLRGPRAVPVWRREQAAAGGTESRASRAGIDRG